MCGYIIKIVGSNLQIMHYTKQRSQKLSGYNGTYIIDTIKRA